MFSLVRFLYQKINILLMKHKSKKKRGKTKHKKRKMKSPLTITIIILVLFVILIVLSVVKGPVEKRVIVDVNDFSDVGDTKTIQDIKEQIQRNDESSSVKTNKAILNGDISMCRGDKGCEFSFVTNKAMKAKDTEICNELTNENSINNCKDDILYSMAIGGSNKGLCAQIKNINIKNSCEEL